MVDSGMMTKEQIDFMRRNLGAKATGLTDTEVLDSFLNAHVTKVVEVTDDRGNLLSSTVVPVAPRRRAPVPRRTRRRK